MTSNAPIAIFVYNRPLHTEETLKYLRLNAGSSESDLIIFSDGPRSPADESGVRQTRDLIANVDGFRSVNIVRRPENWGLARSIISGVTEVLQKFDRIIVLEDDLVTSPQFLNYMNHALDRYATEDRVGSIHAYMYPIQGMPEYFFMRGADCWGWATWRDRWRLLETDGRILLRKMKDRGALKEFNKTGGDQMVRMLIDQIRGKNSSWFIRWHASLFLNEKLTLQPGRSYLRNIGFDETGTHCGTTTIFDVTPRFDFIDSFPLEVSEDQNAVKGIRYFFENSREDPWWRRLLQRVFSEIQLWKIIRHG